MMFEARMFKKIFLLLSIFILFYGCISYKNKAENPVNIENFADKKDFVDNEKELYGYTKETIFNDTLYFEPLKVYYIKNMNQVEFLINNFTQDELSEIIERLDINFKDTKTDLMFLKYFPFIKKLVLTGETNGSIEGMKYLINLEDLLIKHTKVFDISSIANLTSLKSLFLLGLLELKDLSPIENLNSLISLHLWDLLSINDISAISNLKNLEYLNIANRSDDCIWDSIENFNPIFDITNLKSLELPIDRKEKDIKNIRKLKNLEYLKININNQEELSIISDLPQLRKLVIWFGDFNDVAPLLKLNKLEEVEFPAYYFYDIMPLAASKSLKNIRIDFSLEKWYEFLDNDYKLFEENGIGISFHGCR
jgi:hypothetical protein